MLHLFFGVDTTEIWGICGVCRKMARMSHVVDKEIRKNLEAGENRRIFASSIRHKDKRT